MIKKEGSGREITREVRVQLRGRNSIGPFNRHLVLVCVLTNFLSLTTGIWYWIHTHVLPTLSSVGEFYCLFKWLTD